MAVFQIDINWINQSGLKNVKFQECGIKTKHFGVWWVTNSKCFLKYVFQYCLQKTEFKYKSIEPNCLVSPEHTITLFI